MSFDKGWRYYVSGMDDHIGLVGIVEEIDKDGDINLGEDLVYPPSWLEHTTYSPQVGDVVRITDHNCSIYYGDETTIEEVKSDGLFKLRGGGEFSPAWFELVKAKPAFSADPDKSYAENQAAWVKFHGLEVGSKVKVVRKFEENEGGSSCWGWDHCEEKADLQGNIGVILDIGPGYVNLEASSTSYHIFPYFALEPVK